MSEEAINVADLDDIKIRQFKPNLDAIDSWESLREFFSEMGLGVVLTGDQTLEEMGRNPAWWVEVTETVGETIQ